MSEEPHKTKKATSLPETEQLKIALAQAKHRQRFRWVLRSTVGTLLVTAAISVLVAVLFLPVLRIYGSSMNPTLSEGDIVLSVKGGEFKTGDVVAFYYNNKILVKRVIAGPGDWVDMDRDGTVYRNGEPLEESYLVEKALGDCNIEMPYQVPENRWFVLGDNRSVSVDSRNTSVGCVAEEQIVGRLTFCVWPLSRFGRL